MIVYRIIYSSVGFKMPPHYNIGHPYDQTSRAMLLSTRTITGSWPARRLYDNIKAVVDEAEALTGLL